MAIRCEAVEREATFSKVSSNSLLPLSCSNLLILSCRTFHAPELQPSPLPRLQQSTNLKLQQFLFTELQKLPVTKLQHFPLPSPAELRLTPALGLQLPVEPEPVISLWAASVPSRFACCVAAVLRPQSSNAQLIS